MYKLKEKKILGIDIDNVINNLQEPLVQLIRKKLHIKVDTSKYDLFENSNMTDSQRYKFFNDNSDWLHQHVKPNWRCAFYIKKLRVQFYIILITARHFDIAPETQNWLKKYDILYDELHFNTGDKVDACKYFKVNYMIEDSPFNLRKLNKSGISTLIYDQPYNKSISETDIATRVYSWEDIYNKLVVNNFD